MAETNQLVWELKLTDLVTGNAQKIAQNVDRMRQSMQQAEQHAGRVTAAMREQETLALRMESAFKRGAAEGMAQVARDAESMRRSVEQAGGAVDKMGTAMTTVAIRLGTAIAALRVIPTFAGLGRGMMGDIRGDPKAAMEGYVAFVEGLSRLPLIGQTFSAFGEMAYPGAQAQIEAAKRVGEIESQANERAAARFRLRQQQLLELERQERMAQIKQLSGLEQQIALANEALRIRQEDLRAQIMAGQISEDIYQRSLKLAEVERDRVVTMAMEADLKEKFAENERIRAAMAEKARQAEREAAAQRAMAAREAEMAAREARRVEEEAARARARAAEEEERAVMRRAEAVMQELHRPARFAAGASVWSGLQEAAMSLGNAVAGGRADSAAIREIAVRQLAEEKRSADLLNGIREVILELKDKPVLGVAGP